jgi:hypothetical protein
VAGQRCAIGLGAVTVVLSVPSSEVVPVPVELEVAVPA